jgi:hypothetical protein
MSTNVSNWQLTLGQWWIWNRESIASLFYSILRVMVFMLWGAGIVVWGMYLNEKSSNKKNSLFTFSLIPDTQWSQRLPQSVSVGNIRFENSIRNRWIITVPIENPNKRHVALTTVSTSVPDVIPTQTISIPPSTIAFVSWSDIRERPSGLTILPSVKWQRISSQAKNAVLKIQDISISPVRSELIINDGQGSTSNFSGSNSVVVNSAPIAWLTEFTVTSPEELLGFENAPVSFGIRLNSRDVIMSQIIPLSLLRGESRRVRLRWPLDLSRNVEIIAVPLFNPDSSEYRPKL